MNINGHNGYLLINKKFKEWSVIYINNGEFLTFPQILRDRGYSNLHKKCVHCDMEGNVWGFVF